MASRDAVSELVTRTLEHFDDPDQRVSSLVRAAIRIASLRLDYLNQLRFQLETIDFSTRKQGTNSPLDPTVKKLETLIGHDGYMAAFMPIWETWERNRSIPDSDKINASSIAQIENTLRLIRETEQSFTIPAGLTSINTLYAMKDIDNAKGKFVGQKRDLEAIIERTRQNVHDYLIEVETELEAGQRTASVFERGQQYVQESLKRRAPDALEKLLAAEDRLAEGTPESYSQALTSCRRMFKGLADAIYPATDAEVVGADGRVRKMTEDAYQNRILQFVIERLGSQDHSKVMQETLRSLGTRMSALNGLASKGVHSEVTEAEAENCVAWSYMLAADILRLADGTAPAFAPDNTPHPFTHQSDNTEIQ